MDSRWIRAWFSWAFSRTSTSLTAQTRVRPRPWYSSTRVAAALRSSTTNRRGRAQVAASPSWAWMNRTWIGASTRVPLGTMSRAPSRNRAVLRPRNGSSLPAPARVPRSWASSEAAARFSRRTPGRQVGGVAAVGVEMPVHEHQAGAPGLRQDQGADVHRGREPRGERQALQGRQVGVLPGFLAGGGPGLDRQGRLRLAAQEVPAARAGQGLHRRQERGRQGRALGDGGHHALPAAAVSAGAATGLSQS